MPRLVHGDFGPQNLLYDPESLEVRAILDWECAHDGDRVEDLAWAEWIVRLHHPEAVQYLPALFDGYGERPDWARRHDVMIQRCAGLRDICVLNGDQTAAGMWRSREQVTRGWRE